MMTEPGPTVADNTALNRYELTVDGEVAFLTYRRRDDHVLLVHTEVPEVFRGRGYGGLLAKHALDDARKTGKQVIVKCPFVTTWLKRHREYDDMVVARVADDGPVDRQTPREPR
jgi:predicted GNAT family acetyltransferase